MAYIYDVNTSFEEQKGFAMKKKIFLSLIMVIMLISSSITVSAKTVNYSDVKSASWYYKYVVDVSEKGLMSGYDNGKFGPNDILTRSQFASILYRMAGSPNVTYKNTFSDVKSKDWFAKAVAWASESGIVYGYNGKFSPKDTITREQLVVMLYRYAQNSGTNVTVNGNYIVSSDSKRVSSYAQTAMNWAVYKGIISGYTDGTIRPQAAVDRAICATIISQYTTNGSSSSGSSSSGSSSSGSSSSGSSSSGSSSNGASSESQELAVRMLDSVNAERKKVGLAPLELYEPINKTAQAKAEDLYITDSFSHYSKNLGYCYNQFDKAGLKYTAAGENIAYGLDSVSTVMQAWMNSAGHKANILRTNYTHLGVGYYNGYWVQQFIAIP